MFELTLINPNAMTYCVVTVIETPGVTWDSVMKQVLDKVGDFPNNNCEAVYVPVCYDNSDLYGDVIYRGAISNRENHHEYRGLQQPQRYFRFLLDNDRPKVVAFTLEGERTSLDKMGEELPNIALQQLKAIRNEGYTCKSQVPNYLNIPLEN